MSASVTVSAYPLSSEEREMPPSCPDSLTYSFTLPPGTAGPRIAHAATRVALETHGLADMTDAVVRVVGELAAYDCRFTPDAEVYVSLRYRDGEVWVILYDGHARHSHPRLAAAGGGRRCGCWGAWCRRVGGVGVRGGAGAGGRETRM